MALTFQQQSEYISNNPLLARVAAAAVNVAIDVMAEDGATAGHAERAAFAHQVLMSPAGAAADLVYGVVTNANCGTGSSDPLTDDAALEFTVTSLWDAYSNYSPAVVA